jgi:hypothetical protein
MYNHIHVMCLNKIIFIYMYTYIHLYIFGYIYYILFHDAYIVIQLRQIYFDRIERTEVDTMIASIYNDVHSLENIQFLLKYANAVLPQNPCLENCGEIVYAKILELQETLTSKRLVSYI